MTKFTMRHFFSANQNVKLYLFFVLLTYVLVRLLQIDTLADVFGNHWQYLDMQSLQAQPWDSLLHLHTQPPLLNFIAWVLMSLPGSLYQNFILLNSFCVGFAALLIFIILSDIAGSKKIAIIAAILYLISPPTLLNVAYPFYPCLTTLGFSLLIYSFYIAKVNFKKSLTLFIISVCYLGLLRTSFSLAHAAFFVALYFFYVRAQFTKAALAILVLIPMVILLAVPVKNYALYNFFGPTSWAPLNLIGAFRIETPLKSPFPAIEAIEKAFPDLPCKYGYTDVDTVHFKANGEPNYNSCLVLEYARLKKSEVFERYILTNHLRNMKHNIGAYFDSPDGYYFLTNREQISGYVSIFNGLFLTIPAKFHQTRVLCVLMLIFLVWYALRKRNLFLGLVSFIWMIHFVSHTITDGGEGRRFVFDIEFIFYIAIGLGFYQIYHWYKHHRLKKVSMK